MFASFTEQVLRLFSFYNLLLLAQGALATLALSVIGCLVGFGVGFAVAVLRITRSRAMAPVRGLMFAYCLVFRRIPFLVTLMLVFFITQGG